MVETSNNLALRTLLGAQNASSQNSLSALKNNKQAKQAIMAPFQKSAGSQEITTSNSSSLKTASTAIADAAASSLPSNLPRGSLVNLLV